MAEPKRAKITVMDLLLWLRKYDLWDVVDVGPGSLGHLEFTIPLPPSLRAKDPVQAAQATFNDQDADFLKKMRICL